MSRFMQVFRSVCVREALRRDPESEAYMQRRDYLLRANGFASSKMKAKSKASRLDGIGAGTSIADGVRD
eukprot:3043417-Pleurochrysis_carterae.AAC.1